MTIIESAEWTINDELTAAILFRSQSGDHSDSAYSRSDMLQDLGRDSLIL